VDNQGGGRKRTRAVIAEEVPLHLASGYIHPSPRSGERHVRIYLPEEELDPPVVIRSELPNKGGTSVTYAAEQLAAEVIRSHESPTPWRRSSIGPRRAREVGRRRSSWSSSLDTRKRSVLLISGRRGRGLGPLPGSGWTVPPRRCWSEKRCRVSDAADSLEPRGCRAYLDPVARANGKTMVW
jgi:hypothetical protein